MQSDEAIKFGASVLAIALLVASAVVLGQILSGKSDMSLWVPAALFGCGVVVLILRWKVGTPELPEPFDVASAVEDATAQESASAKERLDTND